MRRDGNIVCEFGNSRIQVFDAKDQPVEIIGGPGRRRGSSTIPGASRWIRRQSYVADSQNHRVQKLVRAGHRSATGQPLMNFQFTHPY